MAGTSPKKRILASAEEILAEKGMAARISHIAARAEVSDSVVYHYFKNKEDLLFTIAEERLRDLREKMEEQLLGLNDPLSRLRKLFFFRLHYLDKNRDYGNLLMFECRSKMAFYSHPAFSQATWFLGLLGRILKEGMEKGVFRKDLNIRLVRDAVFGLLDLSNIHNLLHGEQARPLDYERLFDLIGSMIRPSATPAPQDKRDRILRAAETLFAEKGYDNATIQDIAALAGVGDGTVYDYFKNKEDVLFNALNQGFHPSSYKKGFQDHLKHPDGKPENVPVMKKLELFIRRHFLISLTQPSFARIFIIHGIYKKNFYTSEAFEGFNSYMETLTDLVDQGKREQLIRQDISPEGFRLLVLGSFSHMTLRWLISEKTTVIDKAGEINAMTDLVIRSVAIV